MSFKRRFQFQTKNFIDAVKTLDLPEWASGKTARTVLTTMVILLSVAYVYKTSSVAITGYQIRNLENQTNALNAEIKQLETQTADYGSLSSVKSRLGATKMVAASGILYVNSGAAVVAMK